MRRHRRSLAIAALGAVLAITAACAPPPAPPGPPATPDWSECPAAGTGVVQVAVVVDDAPAETEVVCVVVPEGSTNLDALVARHNRIGGISPDLQSFGFGLAVCSIDGIPDPTPPGCFGAGFHSFWTGGATWESAPVGAGDRVVEQGSVDGWNYGVWDFTTTFPEPPAASSDFATLTS